MKITDEIMDGYGIISCDQYVIYIDKNKDHHTVGMRVKQGRIRDRVVKSPLYESLAKPVKSSSRSLLKAIQGLIELAHKI